MIDLGSENLLLVGPTRVDLETLGEYWGGVWHKTDAQVIVSPSSWATTLLPPTTVARHSWLNQAEADVDGRTTPLVALVCCGLGSTTGLGYLKDHAASLVTCELTVTSKNKTWPANAKMTQSHRVEEHSGVLTLTPLGYGGVTRVLKRTIDQLANQSVDIDGVPYANELITTYYVVPEHKAADAVRSPIEAVFQLTKCAAPVQRAAIVIPNADTELVDAAHHMALAGLAGNGDVKRYMQNTVQAMLRTQGTITPAGWNAHIDKASEILSTVSQSVSTVCGMASFHHSLADPGAGTAELVCRAVAGTWSNATRSTARHVIGRAATDWKWFAGATALMVLYLLAPLFAAGALATARSLWSLGAFGSAWASVHTGAAATAALVACAGWQHHSRSWLWLLLIATSYGVVAHVPNLATEHPAPACVPQWLSAIAHNAYVDDFEAQVKATDDLCVTLFPTGIWGNYSRGPVVSTRRAVNRCYRATANEEGDVDYSNATAYASLCRACGVCWYSTPPECWRSGPHRLRLSERWDTTPEHCLSRTGPCAGCPFDVPASNNSAIQMLAVRSLQVGTAARAAYTQTQQVILHYQRIGAEYVALVVKHVKAIVKAVVFNILTWLNETTIVNVTLSDRKFVWTGRDAIEAGSYVIGRLPTSGSTNERPPLYLLAAALTGAIIITRATVQGSTTHRKGRIPVEQATWKHMVMRPPGLYDTGRDIRGLVTTPLLCLGVPEASGAGDPHHWA